VRSWVTDARISGECPRIIIAVLAIALFSLDCGRESAAQKRITPEYDPQTGKLRLLKYDSDGDGKIDTVSYMDGARVV